MGVGPRDGMGSGSESMSSSADKFPSRSASCGKNASADSRFKSFSSLQEDTYEAFLSVPLVSGVLGIALGAAYLASPTWRIRVTVDDDGLTVGSPKRQRFRLAWHEVVRVVASPSTSTCFVDGGKPERSLLVPGDGAPAPYDIADRKALVEAILAHVPADKVQTVASLESANEPVNESAPP